MQTKTTRNLLIFILGIAIIGCGIFWWVGKSTLNAPSEFVKNLADSFEYVINKIPGEQSTFTQFKAKNSEAIHEWATAEKKITVQHRYIHKWGGSTKSIEIEQEFEIKAGFNLSQFSIETIHSSSKPSIAYHLPSPQILSCTPVKGSLCFESNNGLWNRLNDHDRRVAQEQLLDIAREQAQHSDLILTAEKVCAEKLREAHAGTTNFAPLPFRIVYDFQVPRLP